jgi:hypothetical protein
VLLIKQLIKTAQPHEEKEKEQLEQAQEIIQQIVRETEQVAALADRKYKVFALQSNLFHNQVRLVTDTRLWCMEGIVEVLYYKPKFFGKISKPFLLVLFTDQIIYASQRRTPARLKGEYPLADIEVEDNPEAIQIIYESEAALSLETQSSENLEISYSDLTKSKMLAKSMTFKDASVLRNMLDEKEKPTFLSESSNHQKFSKSPPEFSQSLKLKTTRTNFTSADTNNEWENAFAIRSPGQKPLICIAPNVLEKQKWLEQIRTAASAFQKEPRASRISIDSEAFFDFELSFERRDAIAGLEEQDSY